MNPYSSFRRGKPFKLWSEKENIGHANYHHKDIINRHRLQPPPSTVQSKWEEGIEFSKADKGIPNKMDGTPKSRDPNPQNRHKALPAPHSAKQRALSSLAESTLCSRHSTNMHKTQAQESLQSETAAACVTGLRPERERLGLWRA